VFSVLVVDDEDPVLESYEFMLNKFTETEDGACPFVLAGKARSGYEALKLIYETEPDLVFMDINIPGLDGLSVLEEVHKKFPRMVCILSTAYERFDLAQRAIPLGVFAYLVKPVSKRTFFSTLENALAELKSRPGEQASFEEPKLRFLRKEIWLPMTEEAWKLYREELALPSDRGFVILVECEKEQEKQCARIAEKLSFRHYCIFDVMLNRGLFVVLECPDREQFRRHFENIVGEIFPAGSAVSNGFYYGIGAQYRGPELYRSCTEALGELESRRGAADTRGRERLKVIRLRQKIGFAPPEESRELFAGIWEPVFSEDFASA
jgi:two-component system response regulator YesN